MVNAKMGGAKSLSVPAEQALEVRELLGGECRKGRGQVGQSTSRTAPGGHRLIVKIFLSPVFSQWHENMKIF